MDDLIGGACNVLRVDLKLKNVEDYHLVSSCLTSSVANHDNLPFLLVPAVDVADSEDDVALFDCGVIDGIERDLFVVEPDLVVC